MTRAEVLIELSNYLGYQISDLFLSRCETAYLEGHHSGPAGYASLGYFVPFEKVFGHVNDTHCGSWPCRKAIELGQFFRQKTEKGEEIRLCLFGTSEINYK